MCIIRRSKIKKLIRQQRKIIIKPIIQININNIPKLHWDEYYEMYFVKGILIDKAFKTTPIKPRIL